MPLASLPAGDYYAQAIVNTYEAVKRADGKTIWVHFNDGTQEVMQIAAGNVYSDVQKIHVGNGGTVRLRINKTIPPNPRPQDTEWVKHARIQSQKLTAFWGRPVYVYATVLLPKGYNEHPNVKYPTVYTFGHNVPFSFNPDSTRTRGLGQINPVTGTETGYDFYKSWIADGFPRFIAVSFEQATPWFLDSYSVNSAQNGPYGDAMEEEIIPALEKQFRMIGKPYARLAEGASTGGWQTLALQLKHPDFFGGAWVLQPDPIDFRRYQLVDIYADTNAFLVPNTQFTTTERPFKRTPEGQVQWTLRQLSLFEEVLGTRGRSNYQLEGWEAIYGPLGRGRLSEAALEQAHGDDRQERRELHARQRLRPARLRAEELGHVRPEGRGQAALLRRRHGRLLPEPRGLPVRGVPQEHAGAGRTCRSRTTDR